MEFTGFRDSRGLKQPCVGSFGVMGRLRITV